MTGIDGVWGGGCGRAARIRRPRGAGCRPDQTLAERYAPVVRLVAPSAACGHGEPYPTEDVDAVLGNQSVALRAPWPGANS